MTISFIGYRGTGKTTISRLLAKKLAWLLFDTDEVIQQQQGDTITKIFTVQGEQFFRDLEANVIQDLLSNESKMILSTGGGCILRESTRLLLRQKSIVIWLKSSAEIIYQRIYKDKLSAFHRPQLTEMSPRAEISHLLEIRNPLYAECAHLTIDTDQLEPVDIVQLLLMDPLIVSSLGESD